MANENNIQEIIDRETKAWNEKSVHLLLSVFHPDMVWVWPTDSKNLDPISWELSQGRFNNERFSKIYKEWFEKFELIRNSRVTRKITLSKEGDAAFAVVDIDTLWHSRTGEVSHWAGRTGKSYVKMSDGWKMINQVGVFNF